MNGRPDVLPLYPDDNADAWDVTVRFPAEEADVNVQRLVKAIGRPGSVIFEKRRPWGVRLFSRPWRPWHNVKVWRPTGRVVLFEKDADDESVKFKVHGEGRLDVVTARR